MGLISVFIYINTLFFAIFVMCPPPPPQKKYFLGLADPESLLGSSTQNILPFHISIVIVFLSHLKSEVL